MPTVSPYKDLIAPRNVLWVWIWVPEDGGGLFPRPPFPCRNREGILTFQLFKNTHFATRHETGKSLVVGYPFKCSRCWRPASNLELDILDPCEHMCRLPPRGNPRQGRAITYGREFPLFHDRDSIPLATPRHHVLMAPRRRES